MREEGQFTDAAKEPAYKRFEQAFTDAWSELNRTAQTGHAKFDEDGLAEAALSFVRGDLPREWDRYRNYRAARLTHQPAPQPLFVDERGEPQFALLKAALANRARCRTASSWRKCGCEVPTEEVRSNDTWDEARPVEDRVVGKLDAREFLYSALPNVGATIALDCGYQGLLAVYGCGYTRAEVAELLGVKSASLGASMSRRAKQLRDQAEALDFDRMAA